MRVRDGLIRGEAAIATTRSRRTSAKKAPGEAGLAPKASAKPKLAALPAGLTRAIEAGTHLGRSVGPEGKERLLVRHQAQRLLQLLPQIPPAMIDALHAAIERPRGDTATFAKTLLLRATNARIGKLLGGDGRALAEILAFAEKLAGYDLEQLRARATVLDLDSGKNSHDVDPIARSSRRGTIVDHGAHDRRSDNDGLFQRFTGSCGPTVIQMMLAEADPILAFALHDAGLHAESPEARVVAFQETLLERYAGVAVLQADAFRWSRFRNALGQLGRDPDISADQIAALERHVTKKAPLNDKAIVALRELRARHDFPSDEDLRLLRARPVPKRDAGIGDDQLEHALEKHISPLTGVHWNLAGDRIYARGHALKWLDHVARALERGIDVPFGISEPSHWMLLSAVDGKKPNRRFLMSDPLGGRTAWVSEADMKSGVFAKKQFDLTVGKERGYIDCFLLPDLRHV